MIFGEIAVFWEMLSLVLYLAKYKPPKQAIKGVNENEWFCDILHIQHPFYLAAIHTYVQGVITDRYD